MTPPMAELIGIMWLAAVALMGWFILKENHRLGESERIKPHVGPIGQPILSSSVYWRCTEAASHPPTFQRIDSPDEADNIRMTTVSNRPSPLLALSPGDLISTMSYRYDEEYLATLDGEIRRLALEQIEADARNELSAPRLEYSSEYANLNGRTGPMTELYPTSQIARSASSTIFDLDQLPGLVIKYQLNCDDLGKIHPLLRDFWFLRRLEGSGIVPRVFFVCPPTKLMYPITKKTLVDMSDAERRICTAHPDSMVRYLVMAKAGRSVLVIAKDIEPPRSRLTLALDVVRQVIRAVQVLHARGIIHGDIHYGNVVAMDRDETKFGLIDFGLAVLVSENAGKNPRPRKHLAHVDCLLSPFALEGWRATYRDDVFNAVFMGAMLIYGDQFYTFCSGLSGEDLLQFKKSGSFFADRGGLNAASDTRRALPATHRLALQRSLQRVATLAAGVDAYDQVPPYDMILAKLDAAHDISLR